MTRAIRREEAGRSGEPAADFLAGLTGGCRLDALRRGPLLVAVSGGGDSLALLHALHFADVLPVASGPRELVVAHADHGLRPQSGADRSFVEATCGRFGLRCLTERLAVSPKAGEGLEAAARRMRYAFLASAAGSIGARAVLVAHTLEDQVETVLHRLCRGTAVGGLGGMAPVRELVEGIALVRPLLAVSRQAGRRYLETVGQSWVEDASNADTRRARNYLRHEILPRLELGPYPAVTTAIGRLADHARRWGRLMGHLAAGILERHVRFGADEASIDLAGLEGADPDLLGEVFAETWRRLEWPRRAMTAETYGLLVDVALRLADAMPGQPTGAAAMPGMLPGGVRITHEPVAGSAGRLVLRRMIPPT